MSLTGVIQIAGLLRQRQCLATLERCVHTRKSPGGSSIGRLSTGQASSFPGALQTDTPTFPSQACGRNPGRRALQPAIWISVRQRMTAGMPLLTTEAPQLCQALRRLLHRMAEKAKWISALFLTLLAAPALKVPSYQDMLGDVLAAWQRVPMAIEKMPKVGHAVTWTSAPPAPTTSLRSAPWLQICPQGSRTRCPWCLWQP